MSKEITMNGYKLVVSPISPLAPKAIEVQFKKKHPEPQAPTYTVDSVAGIVVEHEHTADSLETEEDKEKYLLWKEAHDEWQSQLTFKLLRLFLSQGVKLKLTKKQKEDIEAQIKIIELDVPENEIERDMFYLETFIINDPTSMEKIIKAVLEETGIKEEALEAANALFPD